MQSKDLTASEDFCSFFRPESRKHPLGKLLLHPGILTQFSSIRSCVLPSLRKTVSSPGSEFPKCRQAQSYPC